MALLVTCGCKLFIFVSVSDEQVEIICTNDNFTQSLNELLNRLCSQLHRWPTLHLTILILTYFFNITKSYIPASSHTEASSFF